MHDHSAWRDILLIVVILNPFAQMLYLKDLMERTSRAEFQQIFTGGTLLTVVICLLFAWVGDFVLDTIFQVSLPALRIFGGLIIGTVAFQFILHGPEGVKLFRGNIGEIAQQISLPLQVGPGLIWISIHVGRIYTFPWDALMIIFASVLNVLMVLGYHLFFLNARGSIELALLKYFAILMRLNALLIGAVAMEMVISGIMLLVHNGFG